jgi:hypothetical protein
MNLTPARLRIQHCVLCAGHQGMRACGHKSSIPAGLAVERSQD